jgi:hypothetical protein
MSPSRPAGRRFSGGPPPARHSSSVTRPAGPPCFLMTARASAKPISPVARPGQAEDDLQLSFYAGRHAGYAGAPSAGRGADFDRGWKAGQTERILDRALESRPAPRG